MRQHGARPVRPYVIVVSGWRGHTWDAFIRFTLAQEVERTPAGLKVFVRVGCARGVDRSTRVWLLEQREAGAPWLAGFRVYEADWGKFGKSAGFRRNEAMVKGEQDPWGPADKLIGFPQPGVAVEKDSGTWGCCKVAFANGAEVFIPSTVRRAYEYRQQD